MPSKRQHLLKLRERDLKKDGWDIDQTVHANPGSESLEHWMTKCAIGYVLTQENLHWTMEAEHDDRGEIDVLCHGPVDGKAYAIEAETGLTDEIRQQKEDQYVHGWIRDVFFLEVNDAPANIHDLTDWVRNSLF